MMFEVRENLSAALSICQLETNWFEGSGPEVINGPLHQQRHHGRSRVFFKQNNFSNFRIDILGMWLDGKLI